MVEYRPGRIQSINADQEIVLKQTYAYLLKYFGYDLNISKDDIPYQECFISSTRTNELSDAGYGALNYGLVRTSTQKSTTSSHMSHKTGATNYSTLSKKKKGGLLGGGGGKKAAGAEANDVRKHAPSDSKRMQFIQTQSSFEKYRDVDIDPKVAYVYSQYHKNTFEHSDHYMSDNEDYEDDVDDDVDDVSSFVTADSTVVEPDMKQFVSKIGKSMANGSANGSGSGSSNYPIEKFNVKPISSILPTTSQYDEKKLHKALFQASRNDAFDNFVLRFVRARKFNPENAVGMATKSLDWRLSTFLPEEWLQEGDAPSYIEGKNKGFIKNFTAQKSYVRGVDRQRNPIFFFKAKKHLISDSPLAETQRFAVFTLELCRLFLRDINDSVDTCSIVFDLTGFSLKNADYNAIKFLAEAFEAHYPECLGCILIFNAPWIFSTVWNVIKNWLDPVVASKIHFTKDFKELNKFIDKDNIPDYMGGEDTYDGEYPVPSEKHCTYMKQRDGNFVKLMKERDELYMKMITTTIKWIESTSPEISDKYLQDKIDLNGQLAENYINLDGYLRYPGFYDRNGSLKQLRC